MLTLVASDASVNREQFYRLLFLTLAELGTCVLVMFPATCTCQDLQAVIFSLRAIFNLLSFEHGPQPLDHRGAPYHNLSKIETVEWSRITKTGALVLNLQFFTVIACSFVFFLCFATSKP